MFKFSGIIKGLKLQNIKLTENIHEPSKKIFAGKRGSPAGDI